MTHNYKISGMTCNGCAAKVKHLLSGVNGVTDASVNLEKSTGEITMNLHIPVAEFKNALAGTKYRIEEENDIVAMSDDSAPVTLKAYAPVFLIFGFITVVTLLVQITHPPFNLKEWMQQFMAGFFLVFSFFKLLDVPAFANSYSSYDIVAKRWSGYGYIYPFIELALGFAFLLPALYMWSNVITLVVMSVSIIGVLQSVLGKQKIQCACLGAVFNLPMSTITIIEDALMIVMSAVSLTLM